MSNDQSATLILLKDSLDEAQISVRAYDTKAQIVGIGYIFTLNVIGQISALMEHQEKASLATIFVAWVIVILPIALFGYVLYPARKSATKVDDKDGPQHMLYLHPERYGSARALIEAAQNCDPSDEIAFELLQISQLRESKRKRFVRGLIAAGFAFLVLFVSQLLTTAM